MENQKGSEHLESEAEWQLAQAVKKIDKLEEELKFYKDAYMRLSTKEQYEQF